MIRPILSAISDTIWTVTYLYAEHRARLARERRDAEERARKAEEERQRAIDERDAAGFAHASALRDIAEARRLADMPATASPQDIVRALKSAEALALGQRDQARETVEELRKVCASYHTEIASLKSGRARQN